MKLCILFLLAALNGSVDQQPTNDMKITSIICAQKPMADQPTNVALCCDKQQEQQFGKLGMKIIIV